MPRYFNFSQNYISVPPKISLGLSGLRGCVVYRAVASGNPRLSPSFKGNDYCPNQNLTPH